MEMMPADPIGLAWLCQTHGIMPLSGLPIISSIGSRRSSHMADTTRHETYVEAMRPKPTLAGHLQFHLRHEVPHFECLTRLFSQTGPSALQHWIDSEPTGRYARQTAFLYEWLTGETLSVPERLGGNYVDAIDSTKLLAASSDHVTKNQRWRINDNLPGTPDFCPLVVKDPALLAASDHDIRGLLANLTAEFGDDLLMRAATWMTLRESKASFAIEGEANRITRIQRFADVMARRTGIGDLPLTDASLSILQREILGDSTVISHFGLRQSPVFVGETRRYEEIVHYIAPPPEDVAAMLAGLRVFLDRTQGQSAILRAAVAAFGFIYIHPLADGNGRVHRFLINDILRRDGIVPEPLILPISAVITDDPAERRRYDRILDQLSKPLMTALRAHISFDLQRTRYADGITSNITFTGVDLARPLWRYPNLGPHAIFLADLLVRSVTEQMRAESRYLRNHHRARNAIKDIIEMPDAQVDRILRVIDQNNGKLSGVLAKEMPILQKSGVWDAIVASVQEVMNDPSQDADTLRQ